MRVPALAPFCIYGYPVFMSQSIADIPKKRGRKPQGGRQPGILVRMGEAEIAAVDSWRDGQGDQPSRPEAIRRLVEAGLAAPRSACSVPEESPFKIGDRVMHAIFGLGSVSGQPVGIVAPDPNSPTGVRDGGWRVPVTWDDTRTSADGVMHQALSHAEKVLKD